MVTNIVDCVRALASPGFHLAIVGRRSVETGKDADLALYDGDPFEYTSHCVGVVIDGKVVSEEKR